MHYSAGTIAPYQCLIALLLALAPVTSTAQSAGGRLTVVNLLDTAIDVEVGASAPVRVEAGASTGYLSRTVSTGDVQAFAPGAPVASGAMAFAADRDVTAAVIDTGSGPQWFFSEDHRYPLASFSVQWMHLASDPTAQDVQVRFGCNGEQWDEGVARFGAGSTLDAALPTALVRGPNPTAAGDCRFSVHGPDGTLLAALSDIDPMTAQGHALRAFLVDQPGGVGLVSTLQEIRPTSATISLAQLQTGLYLSEPSLAGIGVAIYGTTGGSPRGLTFDFDANGQPTWSALDGLINDGSATDLASRASSTRESNVFSTAAAGTLDIHYRNCELEISPVDQPFRGRAPGDVMTLRPLVCGGAP